MEDSQNLKYNMEISPTFDALAGSISDCTLKAIQKMGFTSMTEIQAKSIPSLLEGKDVRATAQTGSGKTLAFLIPVVEFIERMQNSPEKGTVAIIISPTRELSMQTYGVLNELIDKRSIPHGIIMGGANRSVEASKLGKGFYSTLPANKSKIKNVALSPYLDTKTGENVNKSKITQVDFAHGKQKLRFSSSQDFMLIGHVVDCQDGSLETYIFKERT